MGDGFAASMSDIFDDLFGDMMGGARGRQPVGTRARRGPALQSRDHARRGLPRQGRDAQPADLGHLRALRRHRRAGRLEAATCKTCGGHGRVRAQQGFFAIERTCPTCHGRGETIDNPCDLRRLGPRDARAQPVGQCAAGVEDGTRIRLTGEGEAGMRGGPAGDLYIFLSVKPHPFFQRDGADLYCRVPISMVQAALGGEFAVHTLDGAEAKVSIPEGAQSGRQLKLRGKGMPVLRSRDFGDLYIQVIVETPQNLTRRQRELLVEFDAESSHKTHPESAGFFAKMKEFFEGLG